MKSIDKILISLYIGIGMPFGGLATAIGLLANQPMWKIIVMIIYSDLMWPILLFCNGLCPFQDWWKF